jgi:MYXO-CTERM domain-containing protein
MSTACRPTHEPSSPARNLLLLLLLLLLCLHARAK